MYVTTVDLIWLLLIALLVGYWYNAMRVTEMARHAGRQACAQVGVTFLDDSVIMNKLRLRRNAWGQIRLYREFCFEFTSDGSRRHRGRIVILGKQLQDVQLDAYPESPQQYLQ